MSSTGKVVQEADRPSGNVGEAVKMGKKKTTP